MRLNHPLYWTIAAAWKAAQANPENVQAAEHLGEILIRVYGMDRLSWMLENCDHHLAQIPQDDLKAAWGAYTLKFNQQLIS